MPKAHKPRRGSTQFWPRKRSVHSVARVRSWANEIKARPLGFIAYKAGMTHIQILDNRPKSLTKGEKIIIPSTIIDCPPMTLMGVCFYQKISIGSKKITSVFSEKLVKELAKKIQLPKKTKNKLDGVKDNKNKGFLESSKNQGFPEEFDDVRLLVHSNPKLAQIGTKKPKLMEIALGGSKEEKLNYVKENLGKDIKVEDVFAGWNSVDVHGITKGKGFQGTVKRYGVPIRQHKAEKTKRGIGNLGSWTPKRVQFTVPQPGKMGYHLRTEYNKQILKIGSDGKDVTPKSGMNHYGLIKNSYVLLKGSVVGSCNRAVVLIKSIRPNPKIVKETPQVDYISLKG
ncbi:MAG: 50S ribosomal protein L3 [Nanoarchaeota archaeon]|nr:50S ribosomal protein L3 [Nanoarchaeota archaeon]MBU1876383.1 50S ribosomal protein L3 [Nanoarchaeota archaeon]